MLFAFDRVAEMAPQHPEWKTKMPFKAIVTGDREAMAKFTLKDIEVIAMATHTGMTDGSFQADREGLDGKGEASDASTNLTRRWSTSRCWR